MPADRVQTAVERAPAAPDLIDRLLAFEGPADQFLINLLSVQCGIGGASGGAILRGGADRPIELVAVYPPLQAATPPVWLAQAAESAPSVMVAGGTAVRPLHMSEELYNQFPRHHLVLIPLRSGRQVRGVAAFMLDTPRPEALRDGRERLELTTSLLSLYEMRLTLQQRQGDLRRMRMALETLAAVNSHKRFAGAAMAMCNETAARWQCRRVSLGFLKSRYVQLKAMSHVDKFSRRTNLVQDVEATMEECLDQDQEVLYPPAEQPTVSRSAGELSQRHGPCCVLTLPMRQEGAVVAALTVERAADKPFAGEEIESLRLMCELTTARLAGLHEHDRWAGAKLAAGARSLAATLVGPRHAWLKVAAILVSAAVVFLAVARGEYRAEAPFVLEASQRQILTAPFAAQIKQVFVTPGQEVQAGQTLASLDTADLQWQREQAAAEQHAYLKQRDAAMSEGKTAEAQVAQAQADKSQARVRSLDEQIRRAVIVAPMAGTVLRGDWQRRLGAPVESGETLFEVAPLESLRAELSVPEDMISDLRLDQRGQLATVSYPDRHISIEVERINPVAEVVDQKNVFKVRAALSPQDRQDNPWLRPGMEGLAKVDLGSRSYAWMWSRRVVNWVRMKLWI